LNGPGTIKFANKLAMKNPIGEKQLSENKKISNGNRYLTAFDPTLKYIINSSTVSPASSSLF
jgi:hypothetical protein